MKFVALLLCLLMGYSSVFSSEPTRTPSKWWPQGVSVHAGVTGVGVQGAWRLPKHPQWVVRVGGSYISYKKQHQIDLGDSSIVEFRPDFVIGLVQSSVKWQPFRRSSFFLTAGAGYTWRPDVQLQLQALSPIELGGIQMKPEEFGTIDLRVRWSSVVGYAGMGMGRSVPKRRWGFGFELGCYYLGKPKLSADYEGFLETTTLDEQLPMIERNMRGYRFLPNLQFVISYSLVRKTQK